MVSIIVPVYNVENVLHYCIDSILEQTYTDFELILVDDGSTDKSGIICDEYAKTDSRIRVFHNSNEGVSAARNCGIDNSKGEYICFVDSDDRLCAAFLEKMQKAMSLYSADIMVCGYQVVQYDQIVEYRKYSDSEVDIIPREDVFCLVNKTMYSAPWCKLFSMDLIKKNNIRFPTDLSLGEDMVFNFLYTDCISTIHVLNSCLYQYSIDNNQSLLRKYRPNLLDDYKKMNQYISDCISNWIISERGMSLYYQQRYYQYEDTLFNTFSRQNPAKALQKISYNNLIIRSNDFHKVLRGFKGRLNPVVRFSYIIRNYLPILIYNNMRKKIKNDKNKS